MKIKNILCIAAAAALLAPATVAAQGLKVITKDGKATLFPYDNLDRVTTYDDKPEAIDLGLSVKWASFNVGATEPGDPGSRFMWAGTVDDPEVKYNKLTCPYQDPDFADPDDFYDYFLKYCNYQDAGIPDGLTTLEPMDDAATVAYGEAWRMPTKEEMEELITECTHEVLTAEDEYGIAGYKFTGPNGNSIFLPDAGYRYLLNVYELGDGFYYWTSSLYVSSCLYANALCLSGYGANKTLTVNFKGRYMGYPVRAVTEN